MVELQDSFFASTCQVSESPMGLEAINTDELFNSDGSLDIDSETLENNLNFIHQIDPMTQCFPNQQMIQYHPPPHFQKLPEIEDMPDSSWNFDMGLKSENSNKSSWLYSSNLNKVFVKMNTPMNVYPSFNNHGSPMSNFCIRAMIVYTSQNDLPEPVNKCPNHKQGQGDLVDHILRCTNDNGVTYVGHSAGKLFADKLAVVVNMGNIASNEPLTLQFTCQNSCSGGMNRKSTSLIFTLEDINSNILGRKVMHFKVCSCPRRDKEKDESTTKVFPKKRKPDTTNLPSTSAKRIHLTKNESDPALDVTEASLACIKTEPDAPCELRVLLPNEKFKKDALVFMYNAIIGEASRTGQTAFNCYLPDLLKQIEDDN